MSFGVLWPPSSTVGNDRGPFDLHYGAPLSRSTCARTMFNWRIFSVMSPSPLLLPIARVYYLRWLKEESWTKLQRYSLSWMTRSFASANQSNECSSDGSVRGKTMQNISEADIEIERALIIDSDKCVPISVGNQADIAKEGCCNI